MRTGKVAGYEVEIGATRQPEVAQRLEPPDATHQDGERTVWVYRAPGISLMPVIGDLADLGQSVVDRHESIIEFDALRVVSHARQRLAEP